MIVLRFIYLFLLICTSDTFRISSSRKTSIEEKRVNNVASASNIPRKRSFANVVVNTQILTQFTYKDQDIYIYSAMTNENENKNKPSFWKFYFVPAMIPTVKTLTDTWIRVVRKDVRITLAVYNEEIRNLARTAITNKYPEDVTKWSSSWDVVPIMIESLIAYIVRGYGLPPVQDVGRDKLVNPNKKTIELRFRCTSEERAKEILEGIIDEDYKIEIAFYFAGAKVVKTNLASITGEQMKEVITKTVADGGDTSAAYIHRNQLSSFISKSLVNVKKITYTEDSDVKSSPSSTNLQDLFSLVLQRGKSY